MILLNLGIFIFTFAGTRWLMGAGNWLSSVAEPNHRSLHKKSTPSGGGLAIVVGLLLIEVWQRFQGASFFPSPTALLGFVLVAGISFLDDRQPIRSSIRLAIHLAAAFCLVLGGSHELAIPLPGLSDQPVDLGLLAIPFALILTVWFTNLYNFMDGMDGFAGGMTVFGFGGCAALAWSNGDAPLALLCSAVAASGAGFLCWNFPPAKIFMGDVAAAPLGYLVAMVAFLGVKNQSMDLWQPLILFSPFWVDATATLVRRLMKGDRIWEAHRTHAYQRLANAGWGHRKTALAEYALMATMAGAAWQYGGLGASPRLFMLGGLGLLFLLLWLALRAAEKAHQKRASE